MATLQVIAGIKASREGGEVLEPVRRDHARVLDANSAQSHEIETRLHRYDVPFEQDVLVRPAQRRFLVNVETNAVAAGVVHLGSPIDTLKTLRRRPETPITQDLANAVVDVATRCPGPDRLDPRVERLQD